MPYVNVQILEGATREQKAELVKEVTDSLVRIFGKKPEHVHIVIQEITEENCGATPRIFNPLGNAHQDGGYSGLLTDEWKKRQE